MLRNPHPLVAQPWWRSVPLCWGVPPMQRRKPAASDKKCAASGSHWSSDRER